MSSFFKKTINILMILILLNILLAGFYWFVSSKINSNLGQVSGLALELNTQLEKEGRLRETKKIVSDTEAQRQKVDTFFVPAEDIVYFIEEVESLAAISGLDLEISSVAVSDYLIGENESDVLENLNMDLETDGSWNENFYFLNLLESMPYRVSIDRFGLVAKLDTEGQTLTWRGVIGVKVLKIK